MPSRKRGARACSMMKKQRSRKALPNGRSAGEQFAPLPYPMARSDAWRSLSGAAVKVWVELRCRYDGGNNGKLSLSMDEGARLLGLGKATVARALAELVERGFVRVVKPGQWYGRLATEYAVTDRGVNGSMATNDWKRWQASSPPSRAGSLGSAVERKNRNRFSGGTMGRADGTATEPRDG